MSPSGSRSTSLLIVATVAAGAARDQRADGPRGGQGIGEPERSPYLGWGIRHDFAHCHTFNDCSKEGIGPLEAFIVHGRQSCNS